MSRWLDLIPNILYQNLKVLIQVVKYNFLLDRLASDGESPRSSHAISIYSTIPWIVIAWMNESLSSTLSRKRYQFKMCNSLSQTRLIFKRTKLWWWWWWWIIYEIIYLLKEATGWGLFVLTSWNGKLLRAHGVANEFIIRIRRINAIPNCVGNHNESIHGRPIIKYMVETTGLSPFVAIETLSGAKVIAINNKIMTAIPSLTEID